MQGKYVRLMLAGALLPISVLHAATPNVAAIVPPAGPAPSDAEAEAAYAAAQKAFQNVRAGQGDVSATAAGAPQVMVFSDPAREIVPGTSRPVNVSLESIRVVVDVENDSLRDIMHKVVSQAARYTGPWQVKWRLKPENAGLLDERVNLTAEAKFSDFIDLLTDRVKNMSGVQLFVTTFNESRIIMVADTYY